MGSMLLEPPGQISSGCQWALISIKACEPIPHQLHFISVLLEPNPLLVSMSIDPFK